ncbi:hypothetical protein Poli38472_000492 [Pythium oligandrum]|uniref:Mitochondrial fission 1 protein n=1 Tax=Pythium oligandrum TaxID=41045 RepID=A0A8K1FEE3_PYTOL|nr:hypothetical protein Poli38472_000492 [Pythium oligandrum]|eukprot:TMW60450.1 hypothetical protein Poli38472_000492 [Pythium oligandrum]
MEKKRRKSNEEKSTSTTDEWFSMEELEAAREAYLEAHEHDQPPHGVKFRYAVALVKSTKRDDKRRGQALLEDLLRDEYKPKECLYWLALTAYGLGEYRISRSHCERLLRMEPSHSRALALHQCIKDVTINDGVVGLGLVSVVVVAGIALKLLLKR